jgi:cytochrome P450
MNLTQDAIDERLFPNAMEFIPERWTSKQELVEDASCFTPFLTGKASLTISQSFLTC